MTKTAAEKTQQLDNLCCLPYGMHKCCRFKDLHGYEARLDQKLALKNTIVCVIQH